jgi:molybdopterin molybdotransferase
MLSVSEAQRAILLHIQALPPETVSLPESLARVLAEDVTATADLPPFHNSGMDGYAVRAEDVAAASPALPVQLQVVADIPAGRPSAVIIVPGTAARITTGAVLPSGADAVVPVEETDDDARGASPLRNTVAIIRAAARGAHVRETGSDVRRGALLLTAGTVIRPAEIALLAAVGHSRVAVHRRPRVAVLATGDELVAPDQEPGPGQIRNVNEAATVAVIQQAGGIPLPLGIAGDRLAEVAAKLEEAIGQGADLVVASAGVSVGAYDVVKDAVRSHGSIDLWRVNMRPGKPLAFGFYRGVPFFGLPGNPVSALMTFDQFVRPALRLLAGFKHWQKPQLTVTLLEPIESDGRETYARVWIERQADRWVARLSGDQGSSQLHSLTRANAVVVVPSGRRRLEAGAAVAAQLLSALEDLPLP